MKTLREIQKEICGRRRNYVLIHELKAEAIKWVKSKNTGGFSFDIGFDGMVTRHHRKKENMNSIDCANLGEMIGFINFFNLTQEDLK